MPTLDIESIFVWLSFRMYILHLVSSQLLKAVLYTSGKIWSARLIFLFFWQCVWIYPLINIKILTNSNQQTQSYEFTSHIAAFFLCDFDHRDAWNLHTNIIWSKHSTDFKELSPCSVWYCLKFLLSKSFEMYTQGQWP